jgi:hypothetical protein
MRNQVNHKIPYFEKESEVIELDVEALEAAFVNLNDLALS